MKKTVFILLLAILSISAFSQRKGDLTVGAKGGYVYSPHYYNGSLYGLDVAYSLSDPFEVVATFVMNPSVPYLLKDNSGDKNNYLAVYSANVDFRLYLIHQQTWATGPVLGGQYYIVSNNLYTVNSSTNTNTYSNKALGFNLGWHIRVNLTDNLTLNGGWRYTNAKAKNAQDKNNWWDNSSSDISYNLFYIGIAYTFELVK